MHAGASAAELLRLAQESRRGQQERQQSNDNRVGRKTAHEISGRQRIHLPQIDNKQISGGLYSHLFYFLMKKLRALAFIPVILLFFYAFDHAPAEAQGEQPAISSIAFSTKNPGALDFIAYGDIRFTDPADRHNTNPRARQALVDRIAREKPELLLMTGDVVLTGDHADDWQVYDRESKPLHDAGITIFPAIGNHDLRDTTAKALPYFFERFPQLKGQRWYSVDAGPIFIIVMDSQSDESEAGEQGRWLLSQLDHVPTSADFVVVTFHHPCYTKSSSDILGNGHPARPQEQHLAQVLEERAKHISAKMLVVNGHVHNYERYKHGGVMYVVSGGGGAKPTMVKRSAEDFYKEAGATYHYIKFHVADHQLHAEMAKYEDVNGGAVWKLKDSFDLSSGK
jgi:acid phosphatase type 7